MTYFTPLLLVTLHSHKSSFPPSFFSAPPPPTRFLSQDGAETPNLAAEGYDFPSMVTRGSQLHHWSSGTPARAEGMWLPHPRQDFFAEQWHFHVRVHIFDESIFTGKSPRKGKEPVTHSKLGRWRRNTWFLIVQGILIQLFPRVVKNVTWQCN